ncbi:hypothetical protein EV361DRAFT_920770 [Lentinula raphanica]|nr:hypothetical protein EV361DRAFT_920770 [Lentinula raphanica]
MFDAFEVCQFLKQHRKKSQPDGLRLVQKRGLTDEQNKISSSTAGPTRVNTSNPLILFPNLKTPSTSSTMRLRYLGIHLIVGSLFVSIVLAASIEPQKPKVTKLSIAFSEQKPSTMEDGTGASSKRQSIRKSGKSSPQSKNDGVIEDIVYSKFMRKIIKEQFELDLQESKLEISGTPVRSIDDRYHFDVALSLNLPIQEWKGRAAVSITTRKVKKWWTEGISVSGTLRNIDGVEVASIKDNEFDNTYLFHSGRPMDVYGTVYDGGETTKAT